MPREVFLQPLLQLAGIGFAAESQDFVGRIVQVRARQFAIPPGVDLETQTFHKGIGENSGLRTSETALPQPGADCFSLFRRVGGHQHQIKIGVLF